MNSLVTFNFKDNQVRTEIIDGEPWFSLLDCCKALAIKNASTSVKLPEAGVGKTYCSYESGKKEITIINEPNLYRLIFRSNKPQAQAFADWVYSEVLPSIRKTGGYGVPSLTNDRAALKAIGRIVKRCAVSAVREAIMDVMTTAEQPDFFGEVKDEDLIRAIWGWYAGHHKKTFDAIRAITAENDELKCKLLTIKKAVN